MTREGDRKSTLATALDRILWDNSSSKDRRFLLAPLSRMFEGIAWEPRPRPSAPVTKPNEPDENVEP
jgi:hypothetical protein